MNFSPNNFMEIREFRKQHTYKVSVVYTPKKFTAKQIH